MKIETRIPNKRLLQWLTSNSEKIDSISYESGYCGDYGQNVRKYDILIADGWQLPPGIGGRKFIIESSGAAALALCKMIISE